MLNIDVRTLLSGQSCSQLTVASSDDRRVDVSDRSSLSVDEWFLTSLYVPISPALLSKNFPFPRIILSQEQNEIFGRPKL